MFQSARFKLTAWYLLIIMCISVLFSIAIYNGATREIKRAVRVQEYRREYPDERIEPPSYFIISIPATQVLEEAQTRLEIILILINAGILIIAGGAGYLLAGITLRPIQMMVDEQNRFITDASHELRTPLTAAKTELEVTLRDKHLNLSQAKQVLESNLEEINAMQLLSDSLLRLAQYPQNNGKPLKTTVTIDSAMSDAWKKVSALAKAKGISFNKTGEKLAIHGDKQSITELFIILFDNAIKYNHQNGTIMVHVERIDGKIMINVQDSGVGIPHEDIPHIFDRFYRVEKSRSRDTISGYGLGLSIAKKIVEEQNGTIAVSSEVGKGSTFTLQFQVS